MSYIAKAIKYLVVTKIYVSQVIPKKFVGKMYLEKVRVGADPTEQLGFISKIHRN